MPSSAAPVLHHFCVCNVPSSHFGELPTVVCSYTFSRLHRDERILRGAAQASVTLLSLLPFPDPLQSAVIALGPRLLESFTNTAPQVFIDSLQAWPQPVPGVPLCLDIEPHPLTCVLPCDDMLPFGVPPSTAAFGQQQRPAVSMPSGILPGVFHEADLFELFEACGVNLWPLWELVLLAEPLLVFSRDSAACSRAVLALVSLVAPLPFAADFRPLFSIQDVQVSSVMVRRLLSAAEPSPSALLPALP
jgi:hypothetical protein